VAVNPPRALIAEAVNVVIYIAGRGRKRRIERIARVVGFDGTGYQLADALEAPDAPDAPAPEVPRAELLFSVSLNHPGELP
jgi:type IV secretion system protein VirB11